MEKAELMRQITEQAELWYNLGCDHYGITPKPLKVVFKKRGVVGGTACTFTNTLDFNLVLAYENQDEYLKQIIPHEVAHLIAEGYYKRRCNHDYLWQGVMRVFGLNPDRCHSMDVTNARVRTTKIYTARCACGDHKVTKRVYDRVELYTCRKCKEHLRK